MRYAWEYALKAAKNLDAQGQRSFTPQQLLDEAMRLGWPKNPETIRHHVIEQMCSARNSSPRQYFDRIAHGLYRLNDAGLRAEQGM